jgi:MazG family protein
MSDSLHAFIQTIAKLRGPGGCPWDREQTHASLARYLLEETYEVLEAIHEDDARKIEEELGDLLLQIVLNAQIAKDNNHFDIFSVAERINNKMINRHPHVFGGATADNAEAVVKQWNEIKEAEKEGKGEDGSAQKDVSALHGVPKTLPALMQSLKISQKAVNQGFEWQEEEQIWQQLESEIGELKEALKHKNFQKKDCHSPQFREAQLELGDILFTLVNIARWNNMNPEECLILALEKFKVRFEKMETLTPKPLKDLSFEEYENLWKQSKALT